MNTSADNITTMGLISKEVYDDGNIKKYFIDNPKDMILSNNHTYKVIKHTDPNNQGFNALLLEEMSQRLILNKR